jgi:hypothetical protein
VIGIGQGVPASINVTGTAAGCKEVKVVLTCTSGKAREMVVPVAAGGSWEALFKDVKGLNCRCGRPVTVTAQCTENPNCVDQLHTDKLPCHGNAPH